MDCGGIHVEAMPWVSGKRRFTRALMVTLARWARVLTWKQVAALFRCSWDTVEAAVDEAVAFGLAHRDLSAVTHIGIDEISRKRGHVYVTNVYDLKSRQLLWSGEGRARETLEGFFDWFGEERSAQLEGVCCDMWQPYADVVKARAPKAILVFDKFHIVQHLTKAVDQVRRDEIREKGKEHKVLMSKTRYIWLKNPWNLTEKQQARLSELEHLNLKINRAYLLKESFRQFWSYTYAGWAERYLDNWFWWATHSRLGPMREFAWMLRRHQEDLRLFVVARGSLFPSGFDVANVFLRRLPHDPCQRHLVGFGDSLQLRVDVGREADRGPNGLGFVALLAHSLGLHGGHPDFTTLHQSGEQG